MSAFDRYKEILHKISSTNFKCKNARICFEKKTFEQKQCIKSRFHTEKKSIQSNKKISRRLLLLTNCLSLNAGHFRNGTEMKRAFVDAESGFDFVKSSLNV